MKNRFWKKGDKVIRIYGSNNWSDPNSMRPGDIGTLIKNQKYPGSIDLKEFPGYHDPIRFRRLKDHKDFTATDLVVIWNLVDHGSFEDLIRFIRLDRTSKRK